MLAEGGELLHFHYYFTVDMNQEINEGTLSAIAELIVKWQPLIPYLGLTRVDESNITQNYRQQYEEQKKDMLRRWCDKVGDDATPDNFRKAALRAGNKGLADNIKKLPFDNYRDSPPVQRLSSQDNTSGTRHRGPGKMYVHTIYMYVFWIIKVILSLLLEIFLM